MGKTGCHSLPSGRACIGVSFFVAVCRRSRSRTSASTTGQRTGQPCSTHCLLVSRRRRRRCHRRCLTARCGAWRFSWSTSTRLPCWRRPNASCRGCSRSWQTPTHLPSRLRGYDGPDDVTGVSRARGGVVVCLYGHRIRCRCLTVIKTCLSVLATLLGDEEDGKPVKALVREFAPRLVDACKAVRV